MLYKKEKKNRRHLSYFHHFRKGASIQFGQDNPINQVKHVACASFSKEDNQLGNKRNNQSFSEMIGTNGSVCCAALIMARSLHSSSCHCSLSFSSPLHHLIT